MLRNGTPSERAIDDLPLLARLPAEDRKALAARARLKSYTAGTAIFGEGEPGDSLHVIVEGHIRIVTSNGAGDEATLAVVHPGDCVGDLSLLDGRPRSASAIAATATKTLVVTREAFTEWIEARPAAALALLETLSLRLRRTNESVADLMFLDLPHRLAKRLATFASEQRSDPGPVRIRVTQAELASLLGVSRESVNKQLNAFGREGWLSLARGAVIVHDEAALRALL